MFRNIEEALIQNMPRELRDLNIQVLDEIFEDQLFIGIKSKEAIVNKLRTLIRESLIIRFKKSFKLDLHS
jgi:hypothetical protein